MQVCSAELFVCEFLLKTETRSRYKKRVVIQQLLKKPTPSHFYIFVLIDVQKKLIQILH